MEDITASKNLGSYMTASSSTKRNTLIIIAVLMGVMVLLSAGYIWFKSVKNRENQLNSQAEDATKGVLPSFSNNPLEGKPNLNPAENSNPIKEIKTNPFE